VTAAGTAPLAGPLLRHRVDADARSLHEKTDMLRTAGRGRAQNCLVKGVHFARGNRVVIDPGSERLKRREIQNLDVANHVRERINCRTASAALRRRVSLPAML
jgi:hypothetical protein